MPPAPRPAGPHRAPSFSTTTPMVMAADAFSYGYAGLVMWATLQFDLQFQLWQGIAFMVIFVLLRGVARELRRDARREVLHAARRQAVLRAASPARWSVEQRDGIGRHVDLGA